MLRKSLYIKKNIGFLIFEKVNEIEIHLIILFCMGVKEGTQVTLSSFAKLISDIILNLKSLSIALEIYTL